MRGTIYARCLIMVLSSLFIVSIVSFAAEQKGHGRNASRIERGRYLVTLGGCNDCHTPKKMTPNGPVPDETRLLAGHPYDEILPTVPPDVIGPSKWGALVNNNLTAWVGPWGTSYTSNLTPDKETGFGNMNEGLFIKILRTGKFMGGERDILPPMPWYDYAKLSDEDLKAIFAYLKSLKPVKNKVPPPVLAAHP